jgi:hypothetical protein
MDLLPPVLAHLVAAHEHAFGIVAATCAVAVISAAPQQRLAEQQVRGPLLSADPASKDNVM